VRARNDTRGDYYVHVAFISHGNDKAVKISKRNTRRQMTRCAKLRYACYKLTRLRNNSNYYVFVAKYLKF